MNLLGRGAWRLVISAFLSNFAVFGLALNFGLFQEYYQHEVYPDENAFSISWVACTLLFLIHLGEVAVRPMKARIGPRPLMLVGTVFCVAAWIGSSFVHELYQVCLLLGLLLGVGSSMIRHASSTVDIERQENDINRWFIALSKAGSPLGGLVWSLVVPIMLREIGLSWTYRAIGLISLVLFAIPSVLVMDIKYSATYDTSSVESVTSTARYAVRALAMFFVNLGAVVPLFYLAGVGVKIDLSREMAGYTVTVFHVASLLGQLLWESLTPHIGRMYLMLAASVIVGIVMFFWILMINLAAVLVFAVIFGLLLGPMLVETSASLLDTSQASSNSQYNMVVVVSSLGLLIGGPISGAILDSSNGSLFFPAFAAGGCILFGSALLVASHARLFRWRSSASSNV